MFDTGRPGFTSLTAQGTARMNFGIHVQKIVPGGKNAAKAEFYF
jgi:hypothetical protein